MTAPKIEGSDNVDYKFYNVLYFIVWPRGLMVKALVFGTKDCAFESHRGRMSIFLIFGCHQPRFLLSISLHAYHND